MFVVGGVSRQLRAWSVRRAVIPIHPASPSVMSDNIRCETSAARCADFLVRQLPIQLNSWPRCHLAVARNAVTSSSSHVGQQSRDLNSYTMQRRRDKISLG